MSSVKEQLENFTDYLKEEAKAQNKAPGELVVTILFTDDTSAEFENIKSYEIDGDFVEFNQCVDAQRTIFAFNTSAVRSYVIEKKA